MDYVPQIQVNMQLTKALKQKILTLSHQDLDFNL